MFRSFKDNDIKDLLRKIRESGFAPTDPQHEQGALERLRHAMESFLTGHRSEAVGVVLSHESALQRIADRGLDIRTIIDVGASDGIWSARIARRFWPDSRAFAIEGFEYWAERLEKRKRKYGNFEYIIAAAGDEIGEVYFLKDDDRPTSGHAYQNNPDERYQRVEQTTIDTQVAERGLEPPFLIKLDTHGPEGEILEGAKKALARTNLLVIEVNNFGDRGRMRFPDLCKFVEERGFRCADIATPTWRPTDNVFWQCDMFFLRADRPEFDPPRRRSS